MVPKKCLIFFKESVFPKFSKIWKISIFFSKQQKIYKLFLELSISLKKIKKVVPTKLFFFLKVVPKKFLTWKLYMSFQTLFGEQNVNQNYFKTKKINMEIWGI